MDPLFASLATALALTTVTSVALTKLSIKNVPVLLAEAVPLKVRKLPTVRKSHQKKR